MLRTDEGKGVFSGEKNCQMCVYSRSKQMPYTHQIIKIILLVHTYFGVTIQYKFYGFNN